MPCRGVFSLLCVLLLPLAGAARGAECVGVVPGGGGQHFWAEVEAGARTAADDGGRLAVYFRGPAREGDVAAQLRVIDKVVAQGCRALVIAPAGAEINARVAQLRGQGIPTYFIDRDSPGGEALAVIATDNYRAGQLAGERMAALLGGQGRVAVLGLAPSVVSTRQREQGFIQAVRAAGLQVTFEGYLQPHGEETFAALQAALPGLDGVFTPNGLTTSLTLAALRRQHQAGQRVHIGFDSSPLLLAALQQGELHGLMLQQPYEMGYQAVALAQRVMDGGPPPQGRPQIALDVLFVTRDSLQQPQVRQRLQSEADAGHP